MKLTLTRSLALAGVAAVAFAGCLKEEGAGLSTSHASAAVTAPAVAPVLAAAATAVPTAAPSARALPDFTSLVEQTGPAVVNIAVTSVQKTAAGGLSPDDPFYDFLRRFGMPGAPGGQGAEPQPRISQGVGSGFIVSGDGYVLTNAHVVDKATEVTVRLTDKREFKAKVVGSDKRTDVALLKIAATGLPAVKIGNPEQAKVGEWVVAMGSPFGFDNTVTAGIISAKARRLPDETFVPFLQTDVAINPGNSGGPLFNLNGEVIGINSQIYSRSGGFMGISFAIPIDVAMKVKDQLQKYGKVQRGKLGVLIQGMDDDLAQTFGLDKAKGALVAQVEPNGPAAKAGLQAGDVILGVDGTTIDESADLPRFIGERHPGDKVKLKVWRDKASRDVTVALGEQQAEESGSVDEDNGGKGGDAKQPSGKLGVAVRPLSAAEANQVGVPGGLLVERASGAAAKAGIQPGDVILGVNNTKVTTLDELRKQIDAAGDRFALLVMRNGNRVFVPIRLK